MKHLLLSEKSTRMVPNSNCNNEKRVYMDEENEVLPCEDIDRDPAVAKVFRCYNVRS